ncbi:FCD domain-containing protein [Nocardiopsis chromatogenes]|uniref:FCD domain-containing protein n=1 Tax=Nocardiopsis chromatogenes TaxID=280239 RepID=UPI00034AE297|nr:FCD domain-containing protein [Nocardiopsis chromatogenes]
MAGSGNRRRGEDDAAPVEDRPREEVEVGPQVVAKNTPETVHGFSTSVPPARERGRTSPREQSHRRFLAVCADPASSADEHEGVLAAVLSGDPARAAAAMEEHLQVTPQEIETRPAAPGNGGPEPF